MTFAGYASLRYPSLVLFQLNSAHSISMLSRKTGITVALIVIGSATLVGCRKTTTDPITLSLNIGESDYDGYGSIGIDGRIIPPLSQSSTTRSYEDKSEPVFRFSTSLDSVEREEDAIFDPSGFFVDDDGGRIYVIDRGRQQVRSFDASDGKFLTAYGAGKGDGPNENRLISGVNVDADGTVWILGTRRRLVRSYNSAGELLTTSKFEMDTNAFARIDSGYVLLGGMNRPKVFSFFSEDGTRYAEAITFAKKPILNIGMTGALIPSDSGFVYVGLYSGRVARFRNDGSLGFFRSTLYPTIPPRLSGSGLLQEVEGPIRARFPTNSHASTFYVGALGKEDSFMDAYDLRDGSYLYSIPNPVTREDGCWVVWVTDRHLYSSCPSGDIAQWSRPLSSRQ